MACEICGAGDAEQGSWVQCPIHLESICQRHCYTCEHHLEAGSMSWCGFWGESFQPEKENGGENA